MKQESKLEIFIDESKCTGCRMCQLICSFKNHGEFSQEKSYIKIENAYILHPKITISDGCINCEFCIQHCLYGALKKRGDIL
jgi:Fe-S-cluster-containing dehydrogenase component